MIDRNYAEQAWQMASQLLSIDSPTGFTDAAADWAEKSFAGLGFPTKRTGKGGVLVDLGGEDDNDGLLLNAHLDTIGAMVAEVKASGRLRMVPLGGASPNTIECENVRVYTHDGKIYEGTVQLCNPSMHVNAEQGTTTRTFDTLEVVLDEAVQSKADAKNLGIDNGDIVCFEPRIRRTATGYLKSRFLDDKLLVGIAWAFAKYIADNHISLKRRTYLHLTVYEEVGHGGSATVPEGITEGLSLDMGCVGDGIACTERQVSICAKDMGGPYSYQMVSKMIDVAKKNGIDYAVDIYPRYSSDVETTIKAGFDIRHGLIGPGVYASHGYERSHMDGVYNTLKLLCGYLGC